MTLEDPIMAEAERIRRELADHDPVAFTRRLAERVAEQQHAQDEAPRPRAPERKRSPKPDRPRPARVRRRRSPLPKTASAPAPGDLRRQLKGVCAAVLTDHPESLEKFVRDYDDVGARVFACLLYSLDRHEGAVFWWRFAAGAGDHLAAHCLAIHHAADGSQTDARLWHTIAHTMGYNPQAHLPQPAADSPEPSIPDLAHTLSQTLDGSAAPALQAFVREPALLPRELAAARAC